MIFGRIVCLFKGHRRGKFVEETELERIYACSRCGRETRYRVKAKHASVVPIQKAG